MEFGVFPKKDVFQIENSKLHLSLGEGIKTVEFILLKDSDKMLFVEAKSSCPNYDNRQESEEKAEKFEEYFSDISDKFIDSLQMMLNVALQRDVDTSGIGEHIKQEDLYSKIKFCFVLVVRKAEREEWLVGPKVELEARLLHWKKLWKVDIVVLNEELAFQYGLIGNTVNWQ